MCDYCGCRSHPAIASLSADHEVLLDLLGDLRGAAAAHDCAEAVRLLERLHGHLEGHAVREERGVFAELRHAGIADSYLDWFERDHARIHALLDGEPTDGVDGAVQELVELLGDHILREESDLFPVAHQLLTPEQWDEVDAVHNGTAPSDLPTPDRAGGSS